ncbi:MAG: CIA30 family protein [Lentimonas sp.]
MKHKLLIALLMLLSSTVALGSLLKPFQWEHRVLLIQAPASDVGEMVFTLNEAREQITDRDIAWFVCGAESLKTNYLKSLPEDFGQLVENQFLVNSKTTHGVRLVGKDGGLKASYDRLDLADIFSRIDSMPMRETELLQSKMIDTKYQRQLFDFVATKPPLAWSASNDGVMGGLSRGGANIVDEGMRFSGVISLENNGGFSSINTRGSFDLSAFEGIRFMVKGDGRSYQLRLSSDAVYRGRGAVSFGHTFTTQKGEWIEVFVPFSELNQTWRGRQLSGYDLNTADIRRVAFFLADKKSGDFSMILRSISAVGKAEN